MDHRLQSRIGAPVVCSLLAFGAVLLSNASPVGSVSAAGLTRDTPSPIQHVVLILQENHSFDDVLGAFCAESTTQGDGINRDPCDGATTGVLPDGTLISLMRGSARVPEVDHRVVDQERAIDGGKMDGFALIKGCGARSEPPYRCYSQYEPTQLPNTTALAASFALSDRTFTFRATPSWGGHMVFASATLDGFVGNNPVHKGGLWGWGTGCDSYHDAIWSD